MGQRPIHVPRSVRFLRIALRLARLQRKRPHRGLFQGTLV